MARSWRRRAARLGSLTTATGRCLPHLRCVVIVTLLPVLPSATAAQPDDASALPRTPWGDPDLQGIWLYQTSTPLEREEALADQAVLFPGEAAACVEERHAAIERFFLLETSGDWCGPPGPTGGPPHVADHRSA